MPWTLPKNHNLNKTNLVDYETEPDADPTTGLTPFETIKKMIESDSPNEEEIMRIILDGNHPLTQLGTEKLYDLACEKQLGTLIKLMEQNINWIGTLNPSRNWVYGKRGETRCTLKTAGGRKRKSRTHIKKGTRKHKSRAKTKRFTRK
jgi:hypothetical protein